MGILLLAILLWMPIIGIFMFIGGAIAVSWKPSRIGYFFLFTGLLALVISGSIVLASHLAR